MFYLILLPIITQESQGLILIVSTPVQAGLRVLTVTYYTMENSQS